MAAIFPRLRRPLPSLAAVLLLWCAAIALVGTSGNFPLSDDWVYAHLVRALCEGRGYDPLPWTGASAVVQALYGAAVCSVAGFSHEHLRWTTLAVSAVGIVSFHALLRELGADLAVAAAGAAVLAFSPLWFNQSFTFMTDVPFASLSILAAWLYVRAFREDRAAHFLVAGAAAAAAFLVRQHALAIAVAAAAAALWPLNASGRTSDSRGSDLRHALAALALPAVAVAAYALWVATAPEVPLAVRNKVGEAFAVAPLAMAGAGFRSLATLGFLFLPWALAFPPRSRRERGAFAACFALMLGAAAFLYAREGDAMFYLTNVLADFTVGAITTRDVLFLAHPLPPEGGAFLRAAITLLSLAGAAALVARLAPFAGVPFATDLATGRPFVTVRPDARPALFCWIALLLSALGTLVQAHYYFDRYVLVLLPLAIAAVVAQAPPRASFGPAGVAAFASFATWAGFAGWAALAVYGVAGTHDYMEWNRARWSMLEALEARGVTAKQIDGGVEYNATRLAAELRTAPNDAQARSGQPPSAKSWWWVEDDEWIVAFRPLEGYAEADRREFARWLPPGRQPVLLLHRDYAGSDASAPTIEGKR